jgi:hypothetical protein
LGDGLLFVWEMEQFWRIMPNNILELGLDAVRSSGPETHLGVTSLTLGFSIPDLGIVNEAVSALTVSVSIADILGETDSLGECVMTTSFTSTMSPVTLSPVANIYSANFDGTDDGFKNWINFSSPLGDDVTLDTSGFTLSAWVRFDDFGLVTGWYRAIFGNYFASNDECIWGVLGDYWYWRMGNKVSPSENASKQVKHGLSINTWYHLAFTYENTGYTIAGNNPSVGVPSTAGNMKIYVNGTLASGEAADGTADVDASWDYIPQYMTWLHRQRAPLGGDISSTATTIPMKPYGTGTSAATPTAPKDFQRVTAGHRVLQIGTEQILVNENGSWDATMPAGEAGDFTVPVGGRGYNGTTAASHDEDDIVWGFKSLAVGSPERYNWTNIGIVYTLKGYIDEAAIHNTDLSAAEVLALCDNGSGGTVVNNLLSVGKPENLIAWYRMGDNNSGTGTTITNMADASMRIIDEGELMMGASIESSIYPPGA